ncbi:MAG: transporter, family, multidrug resistance protein [Clostridia bacterium]|nr:transporter, family, multidrug resistance protein [Clostridia bacterium]
MWGEIMEEIKEKNKKLYKDTNLKIIFSITLMAVLGVSSITPAFPKIAQVMNISKETVGLLITVFTLPGVILTPILGILADRFGRKRILVPSLIVFGIAGGACAFTSNFNILLLLRFIQGVGAAALGSLNATLIGDIYSGHERAEAMGYNASVLSIGTATYPAIGGALALLGWQLPFILPVLAVPIAFLVLYKLNNSEPKSTQNLLKYLTNAVKSINDRQVYVLFTAGVMTFILLYGAYLTYFPFIIEGTFGGTSFTTGLIMFIMSITTAITSSQLRKLAERFTVETLLKAAFLFFAVALVLVPFVPNLWLLLIPVVIIGMGQGINFPSNQTILTGLAPMEYRAAFMSINGMVLRLGQTLGPLFMGLIFGLGGINAVFFVGALLGILMSVLLILFLK